MIEQPTAIVRRLRRYLDDNRRDADIVGILVWASADQPPFVCETDELPRHLKSGARPLAALFLTPTLAQDVWSVRIETFGSRRPASARSLVQPEVFLDVVKEHYRLPLVLEHPAPTVN